MDIKSPVSPAEYGRYDVVHARCLTAALTKISDWDIAVANVVALLKKDSGAVMWTEISLQWMRVYDKDGKEVVEEEKKTSAMKDM
ncbi:MAG: hypothetical protein Q9222_007906, partial [Ikaeria aurantiellina]